MRKSGWVEMNEDSEIRLTEYERGLMREKKGHAEFSEVRDVLAGPWVCRKLNTHYAIEAPAAGNVRVAEVRHVARPDGSISKREAVAIAAMPELAAAAEALLRSVGFGRTRFDTEESERLWDALSTVRGRKIVPWSE